MIDPGQVKFYNQSEEYFQALSQADQDYFSDYFKIIKRYVRIGSTLLDVGCGTGQSSAGLKQNGYAVTGMDASQRYVAYARSHFPEVDFISAEAAHMPFSDNSFEAVASFNTLEHLNELEAGLSEMIRVLKPGGHLIIQSPNLISPKYPINIGLKFKGTTFEGQKNWRELIIMAIRNIYWLGSKRIFGKYAMKYRQPSFDYEFPDSDAANFFNPVDIKRFLTDHSCEIVSYQGIKHLEEKNWSKIIGSLLFPDFMGIVRIAARKKESVTLALVNATLTGGKIPPLGLLSLASFLAGRQILERERIKIFDINLKDPVPGIIDLSATLVVISAMTVSYPDAVKIARRLKKLNPKIELVIGGVHISLAPESFDPIFSIGVIGEGELTLSDLIQHFQKYGSLQPHPALKEIPGIIYIDSGQTIRTDSRKLIEDLDNLPRLDWSLLADDYFFPQGLVIQGKHETFRVGHYLTTRGCPYKCIFCSTSVFWQRLRMFSAARVVSDWETLYNKYDIRIWQIWDDLFTVSKPRLREIIGLLKQKGLLGKFKFSIQSRANLIDDEMCGLMKEMGVYAVGFGFESGSRRILSYLKKQSADPEINRQAVLLLDKHDIGIAGSFMLGSPTESKEDMEETLNMMKWMAKIKNVIVIWYGLTMPFPGTELWEYARKQGLIKLDPDWSKIDILHTRFSSQAPKLFFPGAISQDEFARIWQEAEGIVRSIEARHRSDYPEAYRLLDVSETEMAVSRFSRFSWRQKIAKVFYKPDRAFLFAWNHIKKKYFN